VITKDPKHPHRGIAKFNLLGKVVYHVGSNDPETMRAICNNKDLSFSQGNSFLFAGIQGAGQKGLNVEGEMDAQEKREMRDLAKAITPQRLNAMAPRLVADAHEAIDSYFEDSQSGSATTASIDLQQTYYPLVFRFTVRIMGMAEYASSPVELKRLINAFWLTQRNSGFWTTILPFVPQPRLLKRLYGAFTLWTMVRATLKRRVETGHREDDYAQDMIDQGHAPGTVSRFVIGGLIAGILNTIGTGAYSVAFVGADKKLQDECRTAVEKGVRRACQARGDDYDDLTALERLQRVRLEEWEAFEEFEILHLVFKESIRLMLTNSLNRYYPGPSRNKDGSLRERLVLEGHTIEDDVYICFSPPSNLHDADAFPSPFTFDPWRYKRGQGQTDYTYIAWGAGYHRCTGQRFAKLETIIALAAFLSFTDHLQTTDDHGKPYSLANVPLPDLSQAHWRSPTKPMRVKLVRASA
jgi:sterol 14-demethylase